MDLHMKQTMPTRTMNGDCERSISSCHPVIVCLDRQTTLFSCRTANATYTPDRTLLTRVSQLCNSLHQQPPVERNRGSLQVDDPFNMPSPNLPFDVVNPLAQVSDAGMALVGRLWNSAPSDAPRILEVGTEILTSIAPGVVTHLPPPSSQNPLAGKTYVDGYVAQERQCKIEIEQIEMENAFLGVALWPLLGATALMLLLSIFYYYYRRLKTTNGGVGRQTQALIGVENQAAIYTSSPSPHNSLPTASETTTNLDKGTQTSENKPIWTTDSMSVLQQTYSPQISGNQTSHASIDQSKRMKADLQRQNDVLRAEVARLSGAQEERGKQQIILDKLLISSQGVEENLKNLIEISSHNKACSAPAESLIPSDLFASSEAIEQILRTMSERWPHLFNEDERSYGASPMSTIPPSEKRYDASDDEETICDSSRGHKCPWYLKERHHVCMNDQARLEGVGTNSIYIGKVEIDEETTIPQVVLPESAALKAKVRPALQPGAPAHLPPLPPPPIRGFKSVSMNSTPVEEPAKASTPLSAPARYEEPAISRCRFYEIRSNFVKSYDAFEIEVQEPKCTGKEHASKILHAWCRRSDTAAEIRWTEWTGLTDLGEFEKLCNETLKGFREDHEQIRRHLEECRTKDMETSKKCRAVDEGDSGSAWDFEDSGSGSDGRSKKSSPHNSSMAVEKNESVSTPNLSVKNPSGIGKNKRSKRARLTGRSRSICKPRSQGRRGASLKRTEEKRLPICRRM